MRAMERLWYTADNTRLVGEGSPEAATLYAAVGDEIPGSAAERLGLIDGWLAPSVAKKAAAKAAARGRKRSSRPSTGHRMRSTR